MIIRFIITLLQKKHGSHEAAWCGLEGNKGARPGKGMELEIVSQNMKDIGTQVVCRNEKHCLPDLPEKTRKQNEVRQVLSKKQWIPFSLPRPQ